MKIVLFTTLSLVLAACASPTQNLIVVDTLYTNGDVYTANPNAPRADAFAVVQGEIVYVGKLAEAEASFEAKTKVDLSNAFVMPGIIDSHAHPGLVALIGETEESEQGLPNDSKESFFNALRKQAQVLKDEPFIVLGDWDVAMFLPEGPHKSDLDVIFPNKPVLITDNSGHSTWLNSAGLAMFGVDRYTPDLSPGVSVFVRDENGEATGWVKEFGLIRQIRQTLLRPPEEIKGRMAFYLSYLSAHGVTTVWDAGNFENDDHIYAVLAEMDAKSALPVRYEGSFHIFDPAQIDTAIAELLKLRAAYSGDRLKFNSIKVHYDGVVEIGTAGMLAPFVVDPDNYGGFLFTSERLAEFLLELDQHDIDLHLHSVGDAATREILDAAKLVRDQGKVLGIELTISHLEQVDETDFARFAKLGVRANFTPHWWGGTYFGDAGEIQLGKEMISRSQPGASLFKQGANVTFSSDVTTLSSHHRANPFLGMQMAVTRQEYDGGPNAPIFGPKSARVTLEEAIAAYTINGARQLGQEQKLGSIEVGKRADFVVLPINLLDSKTYQIHQVKPEAVFIDGELAAGALRR